MIINDISKYPTNKEGFHEKVIVMLNPYLMFIILFHYLGSFRKRVIDSNNNIIAASI